MKKKRFVRTYSQGAIDGVEIWVDTETGVNYLVKLSGYAGGVSPLLDMLKVNSSLLHLDLTVSYQLKSFEFIATTHIICSSIGDSGVFSLSESLKVNSSLTHLILGVSL